MKCLFLGGPWDGKFLDVSADSNYIKVPVLVEMAKFDPGCDGVLPADMSEVYYERGTLSDPAGRYTIYTTGEALKAPIAHMLALLEKKS